MLFCVGLDFGSVCVMYWLCFWCLCLFLGVIVVGFGVCVCVWECLFSGGVCGGCFVDDFVLF